MALNPPLSPDGTPMGIVGEFYFLQRSGIALTLHTHTPTLGKLKANGRMYLTSLRICFVADKPVNGVHAVDIPLQGVSKEDFKQPIFGSNYLEGVVQPVPGRGLPEPTYFALALTHGGAGTFLNVFWPLMGAYREAEEGARRAWLDNAQHFVAEQQAYVDPSDTSVLYISQPASAFSHPRTDGYGYGGGKAGFAPVAAGHAGMGVPVATVVSPGMAPSPASSAYAPAVPGYGPSPAHAGGYAPAPAGYASPPPAYAATPAGYAPAPTGYSAPAGYGPPSVGPSPTPAGYGSPPGYASTPAPGYAPPVSAPPGYAAYAMPGAQPPPQAAPGPSVSGPRVMAMGGMMGAVPGGAPAPSGAPGHAPYIRM